ncbi:hypothetical protein GCM10007291_21410 [Gemmobacter nanjingensis]|uniref:Uncharacterized protein n=1 Tax=Gemmobacter nanjingensis TaxID=488454 RepID=A0ABQ3FFD9_9RHOB|nr:hypothetical protein GCM10007291_21410 [Gemmobacter nanjingensis]
MAAKAASGACAVTIRRGESIGGSFCPDAVLARQDNPGKPGADTDTDTDPPVPDTRRQR